MKQDFQLEKEDIDNLFLWVSKKGVKYKDVKFEIVDHLASGMEDLMTEDPTMSKTKALFKVYENFPITGFANLIQEKEKGLKKYWLRRFANYLLEYLKLPKIIILILIFSVCFNCLLAIIDYSITTLQLYIALLVFMTIFSIRMSMLRSKLKNDDQFLVLKSYLNSCWSTMFGPYTLIVLIFTGPLKGPIPLDGWMGILLSVFVSVWTVILYANLMVFPKMLVKEIRSKYSHLSKEMLSDYNLTSV